MKCFAFGASFGSLSANTPLSSRLVLCRILQMRKFFGIPQLRNAAVYEKLRNCENLPEFRNCRNFPDFAEFRTLRYRKAVSQTPLESPIMTEFSNKFVVYRCNLSKGQNQLSFQFVLDEYDL